MARGANPLRARARRRKAPPEQEAWAVVQGRYRYALGRCWDPALPRICWIMLNPSTADGTQDDPTLRGDRANAARARARDCPRP